MGAPGGAAATLPPPPAPAAKHPVLTRTRAVQPRRSSVCLRWKPPAQGSPEGAAGRSAAWEGGTFPGCPPSSERAASPVPASAAELPAPRLRTQWHRQTSFWRLGSGSSTGPLSPGTDIATTRWHLRWAHVSLPQRCPFWKGPGEDLNPTAHDWWHQPPREFRLSFCTAAPSEPPDRPVRVSPSPQDSEPKKCSGQQRQRWLFQQREPGRKRVNPVTGSTPSHCRAWRHAGLWTNLSCQGASAMEQHATGSCARQGGLEQHDTALSRVTRP